MVGKRGRPTDDPGVPKCCPQVTLKGRSAWVVERVSQQQGGGAAATVAWIVETWIASREGRDLLRESFKVDPADYAPRKTVVPIRLPSTPQSGA